MFGNHFLLLSLLLLIAAYTTAEEAKCADGSPTKGACDANSTCPPGHLCVAGVCCEQSTESTNRRAKRQACADNATNCAQFIALCATPPYVQCMSTNCRFTCGYCVAG
ncbi:hypothetical protein M3Y99_01636700 [Aphelenchoides fujianensis]|nr:hypothetical protein M3Y99_01636700 [Aphelenchoides fujianensis]